MVRSLCFALALASFGCNNTPKEQAKPETTAPAVASAKQAFGAPIAAAGKAMTLAEVAAAPDKVKGQAFVVEGTVGSVCQHRGCWMTLNDDQGEAFIRMQNHAFLIPKDSAGKKARVMATLEDIAEPAAEATCGDGKGHDGCKAEAEKATGKPLAKLELQATGVEIF